jgi:acyl-CoA thioesterase I
MRTSLVMILTVVTTGVLCAVWISAADKPAAAAAPAGAFVSELAAGKKQHIVVYGTSLTASGTWPGLLKALLDKKFPGLVKLTNSGGSGECSIWGLQNIEAKVLNLKADAVFIEFGMNDAHEKFKLTPADARKNLETMIVRIREKLPRCRVILLTMNPASGSGGKARPALDACYDNYREVAKAQRLALIDLNAVWKRLLEEDPATYNKYIPDGVHPSPEGTEKVIIPELERALFEKR